MWRLVTGQVLRRPGRSLAVVAAIVVVAVSFSLLSASVATSRLQVQGTVEENFRTAYDVLVRPAGSQTGLEASDQLVRENYLSGIFGGITMRQYRQIRSMQAVEVAAPVAMVGYVLPSLFLKEKINDLVTGDRQQLYRMTRTWVSDRGLSRYQEADRYVYVTRQRADYSAGFTQTDPVTGEEVNVCGSFERNKQRPVRSAFDVERLVGMSCYSTNPPNPRWSYLPPGDIGAGVQYPFPLLLAAIDPEQEAALVGLDKAVTGGRYLTGDDRPSVIRVKRGDSTSLKYRQLPILMADQPLVDERLELSWERLEVGDPRQVPGRLMSRDTQQWLDGLSGKPVRSTSMRPEQMYDQLLEAYAGRAYRMKSQYWSTGQVDYQRSDDGHLRPVSTPKAPRDTWAEPLYPEGYFAPQANADVGFRELQTHVGFSTISDSNVLATPVFRRVGQFDPDLIEGFSLLSQVPLTTYYPPSAEPGDTRTDDLLGRRPLAPNSNLAGYLQQPPMMLTNLSSLGPLTSSAAFYSPDGSTEEAPISVIRVRVAGVTGADDLSQERVRLAAEQIQRETGLDVDITIGSSPTPQLIDLPAGDYGRPALTLQEGWVSKGVTVRLLDAIDTKSLALFGLVLLVCLLFLLNATIAAVRTRRAELGVLACLGWPARRIFALLLLELLVTGLVAGLIGTGIAAALVSVLDLDIGWWQLAAITPVATLLAVVAGLWPAWRACRARPLQAITPLVRAPRRAARISSITRLAVAGVTRTPAQRAGGGQPVHRGCRPGGADRDPDRLPRRGGRHPAR